MVAVGKVPPRCISQTLNLPEVKLNSRTRGAVVDVQAGSLSRIRGREQASEGIISLSPQSSHFYRLLGLAALAEPSGW